MYIEINEKMVQRISDSAFIPRDPNSLAYQLYLEWKAEQDAKMAENTKPQTD